MFLKILEWCLKTKWGKTVSGAAGLTSVVGVMILLSNAVDGKIGSLKSGMKSYTVTYVDAKQAIIDINIKNIHTTLKEIKEGINKLDNRLYKLNMSLKKQ